MKRIGILHLSDLHCGSDINKEELGTCKDPAFSAVLKKDLIYPSNLKCFFERVQGLLVDKCVDVLVCTGDLGNRHIEASIENGALYLKKLAEKLNVSMSNIVVCPGNHDLNQNAEKGKELDRFEKICQSFNFKYPTSKLPISFHFNDLPIVGMNTNLGGTEHALHDLPENLWEKIKEMTDNLSESSTEYPNIQEAFRHQLSSMDIPAVGNKQINEVIEFISQSSGKTALVIGHHNILPTRNIDIRPYGQLVDSGILLFRLIEHGRRIIFLHGHSHCDNQVTAFSQDNDSGGFLASIGVAGLHGKGNATATYIHLFLSDSCEFLAASIFPYRRIGSDFMTMNSFRIYNRPIIDLDYDLDINSLEKGNRLPLRILAEKMNYPIDDAFAEALLRYSSRCQIEITNIDISSVGEWQIMRL